MLKPMLIRKRQGKVTMLSSRVTHLMAAAKTGLVARNIVVDVEV